MIYNAPLVKKLTKSNPLLGVVEYPSTKDFENAFANKRLVQAANQCRLRVITNRARPDSNGQLNENASKEIIDILHAKLNTKVPTLIYTSSIEKAESLNKQYQKSDPFVRATED